MNKSVGASQGLTALDPATAADILRSETATPVAVASRRSALQQGYQTLSRVKPTVSDDWAALDEFAQIMTKYLSAGLAEVASKVNDLEFIDSDQFIEDLRHEFDPYRATSPIQDNFSDAFYTARKRLQGMKAEPLARVARLPSGAVKPTGDA